MPDELEQYELHHRARIAIKPGMQRKFIRPDQSNWLKYAQSYNQVINIALAFAPLEASVITKFFRPMVKGRIRMCMCIKNDR